MKATPTLTVHHLDHLKGWSARFLCVALAFSPFLPSLPAGLRAEDVFGTVREEGWR